ncbi:MAG: hypothetical protein BGO31_01660 [Bacteroidetes bacterium 43-16]|nr:MAG: hypothetical protein BGO31_01660 [Bacteroidetes bacterium 43-16]
MKKLSFILISMLIAFAGFAQSPSAYGLVVENHTNCTQTYYVIGDELCKCGGAYASPMITIPPGGVHVYPNSTTIPGFPAIPKGIFGAKILDGPVFCSPAGGAVGQAPCGLPPSYGFMTLLSSCTPCAMTKANWLPANNCEEMARLIFTP